MDRLGPEHDDIRLVTSVAPGEELNNREIAAGLAPTPGYRYAQAVGDQLFVAGQVPTDGNGEIVSDDTSIQTTLCLDNLSTLIEVHGFERDDVRHLTVYVTGEQEELTRAWQAVLAWWRSPVPPATLLGVNRLGHHGQLVEIDATIRRAP